MNRSGSDWNLSTQCLLPEIINLAVMFELTGGRRGVDIHAANRILERLLAFRSFSFSCPCATMGVFAWLHLTEVPGAENSPAQL